MVVQGVGAAKLKSFTAMRKLLLCAVMLFGTVCMANAQDKIQFGVRAGMNISSLSGDGVDELDSRIGYHVGAIMDWNVTGNLYVQPGLFFTTRGVKEGDWKMNANYLQIPISVAYRFPVSDNFKVDVNAGPYFAMGIGGKYKQDGLEDSDVFGDEGDCKRFDAGLRVGAGVHIQKFSVGLIYDLGLANISKGEGSKIKNGAFQISVGYNF